ncbi:MAG: hypothetical protein PHU44_07930 [Syntrophales bacterium]|nr:hypothetical protein [Syntrophales bacterium]MDD5640326.1 hypothetical protein [Syntrophales bacterium]
MPRPMIVIILSIILVGTWVSLGAAKEPYSLSKAYNLEKAQRDWGAPPKDSQPNSVKITADLLVGRPLGLVTTTVATGVFVATIPFNLPSRSVRTAAWGVKQVGGWTFKRRLGQYDPRFAEHGIFK